MAETANIATMAEEISKDIFSEFGWKSIGPYNENTSCVLHEQHKLNTHPTDVVFYYPHPYSKKNVYVYTDLKSYASDSINKAKIAGAISGLTKGLECCQLNEAWHSLYTVPGINRDIMGMLFIYNHDGNYDKSFEGLLTSVHKDNFLIRRGCKYSIFGPEIICYLKTIAHDLKALRGDNILPKKEDYYFYYPELFQKKLVHDRNVAATMEVLCGPWQIIRYARPEGGDGLIAYFRSSGSTVEEFLYFIDFLFHYQLVQNIADIQLRIPYADQAAISNFERAKLKYVAVSGADGDISERLIKIKCSSIANVFTYYSKIEIGMRNG